MLWPILDPSVVVYILKFETCKLQSIKLFATPVLLYLQNLGVAKDFKNIDQINHMPHFRG